MVWVNDDGLTVKFNKEIGRSGKGGEIRPSDDEYVLQFEIDYTDVNSATASILDGPNTGPFGVVIPKGVLVKEMAVQTITAPTSSGTVASADLVIGTKKASDRSTELDHDGLSTTAFVIGTVLESAGEEVVVKPGVTGAGDDYGATTTEDGVVVVANSTHATNPYTAGKWRVRIRYFYP